jgi:hypothetical protein
MGEHFYEWVGRILETFLYSEQLKSEVQSQVGDYFS